MAATYEILKHHFDNLILGGYPKSNYLEPIRDSYRTMFNATPINQFDIYSTRIGTPNNPIKVINSFVGDDDKVMDIPHGIMPCGDHIVYSDVHSSEIFKPTITVGTLSEYINNVYHSMLDIVRMDRLYPSDKMASTHPYLAYLKSSPFYFTYHHCAKCFPNADMSDVFKTLLEKYIVSGEDLEAVYKSVSNSRYNPNPENIFAAMSVCGEIPLFS